MGGFLRQATAAQARALGPFVSDTDFKTVQTGLTIANTDIKLVVNGAASANKNSGGGTHRVNGVYGVTFDATDTATVGEMEVNVLVAGAMVVFDKFTVIEEAVYDRDYAASATGLPAGMALEATSQSVKTKTDFLPSATAGAAGGLFIAGSNAATTVNITGNITGNLSGSVGSVTGAVVLPATANIAITGNITGNLSGSVGSVTGSVGSVVGAVGSVTGAVGSVTAPVTAGTVSDKTGYALSATGSAALTEGYRANGATGTLANLLYEILAHVSESAIVGTTKTINRVDHVTPAGTFTLDSATAPTSITRAT